MMTIRLDDLNDETAALVESNLPRVAREFVRLIGLRSALALISEFGGMEFCFPVSPDGPGSKRFGQIAGIIGADHAEKIGQFMGCVPVYIPRALRAMAALRNRQMIADYERLLRRGMSVRQAANDLAFTYRMSGRAVERIVNGETPRRSYGSGIPQHRSANRKTQQRAGKWPLRAFKGRHERA